MPVLEKIASLEARRLHLEPNTMTYKTITEAIEELKSLVPKSPVKLHYAIEDSCTSCT